MALQELPSALRQLMTRHSRPTSRCLAPISRRYASSEAVAVQEEASEDLMDLESESALTSTAEPAAKVADYDPIKRVENRRGQLPPSRYAPIPN